MKENPQSLFKLDLGPISKDKIKEELNEIATLVKKLIVHETSEYDLKTILFRLESLTDKIDPPELKTGRSKDFKNEIPGLPSLTDNDDGVVEI